MSDELAGRFSELGVTVSAAGAVSGTFNCPTGGQRLLNVTCTLAGGSLLSVAIGGTDCALGNSSTAPLNVNTSDGEPLYYLTCSMGEGEGLFQSVAITVLNAETGLTLTSAGRRLASFELPEITMVRVCTHVSCASPSTGRATHLGAAWRLFRRRLRSQRQRQRERFSHLPARRRGGACRCCAPAISRQMTAPAGDRSAGLGHRRPPSRLLVRRHHTRSCIHWRRAVHQRHCDHGGRDAELHQLSRAGGSADPDYHRAAERLRARAAELLHHLHQLHARLGALSQQQRDQLRAVLARTVCRGGRFRLPVSSAGGAPPTLTGTRPVCAKWAGLPPSMPRARARFAPPAWLRSTRASPLALGAPRDRSPSRRSSVAHARPATSPAQGISPARRAPVTACPLTTVRQRACRVWRGTHR
jgi:hypothetical protein